jgi:hypothetical protein
LIMASNPIFDAPVAVAVQSAVAQLVRVQTWGGAAFVNLPMFYPNGNPITVKVEQWVGGYRVSDGGLTYRELEQIGAESYFARNAGVYAGEMQGVVWNRSLCIDAAPNELSAAIADVAATVERMASKIMARVSAKGLEAEIASHLWDRLKAIFGERAERDVTITGPSTKDWKVDAVVHLDERDAVFRAVSAHHTSVYSASAMFHDLALRDNPPVTTAVVTSKADLGAMFNILAQAGNVIEQGQSDAVFESAVRWAV